MAQGVMAKVIEKQDMKGEAACAERTAYGDPHGNPNAENAAA